MAQLLEKISRTKLGESEATLTISDLYALKFSKAQHDLQQQLEKILEDLDEHARVFYFYESRLQASVSSEARAECSYYMQWYACQWYTSKQLLAAYVKLSMNKLSDADFFAALDLPFRKVCSWTEEGKQLLAQLEKAAHVAAK